MIERGAHSSLRRANRSNRSIGSLETFDLPKAAVLASAWSKVRLKTEQPQP